MRFLYLILLATWVNFPSLFGSEEIILLNKTIPVYHDKYARKPDPNHECNLKVSWLERPDSYSKNNLLIEMEVNTKGYSSASLAPRISDFEIFLNTGSGDVQMERPLYSYKSYDRRGTVSDWKLLSCRKRSSLGKFLSSLFYAGINFVPVINTIMSASENIENTVEAFSGSSDAYLVQWKSAYNQDQYTVPRPLRCNDGLGAKAYQIWIPLSQSIENIDLDIIVQRIRIASDDNFYSRTFKEKLSYSSGSNHVALRVPANNCSYSVKPEVDRNSNFKPEVHYHNSRLNIKLNYQGSRKDVNHFELQPTLIFKKGTAEITGLPSFININNQIVGYANLEREKRIKLAFNWALFFAGTKINTISTIGNAYSAAADFNGNLDELQIGRAHV